MTIYINDSSQVAPSFATDVIFLRLSEDVEILSTVFELNATDPDDGLGGKIAYSILSQSEVGFGINQSELIVVSELDYESIRQYTLVVQARDFGEIPLFSNVTFQITIENVNDNFPEIINVKEGQKVFYLINRKFFGYKIICLDLDLNDAENPPLETIVFTLVEPIPPGFEIDESSGQIFVRNFEITSNSEFQLTVQCSDQSETRSKRSTQELEMSQSKLDIVATEADSDFFLPLSGKNIPISVTVQENEAQLKKILTLSDFIEGSKNGVDPIFTMQSTNLPEKDEDEYFSLTLSGELWTVRAIDREAIPESYLPIALVVEIQNSVDKTLTTFVTVRMLDKNSCTLEQFHFLIFYQNYSKVALIQNLLL